MLLMPCILGSVLAIGMSGIFSSGSWFFAIVFGILSLFLLAGLAEKAGVVLNKMRHDADDSDAELKSDVGPVAVFNRKAPQCPSTTPEGQKIRYLDWFSGENGTPKSGDCLLPDGTMIERILETCFFSDNGRYFIATYYDKRKLILLDRDHHRLYIASSRSASADPWRCDHECIYMADGQVSLSEFLHTANKVDLTTLHDLWLMPTRLKQLDRSTILLPAGRSGAVRELRFYLPPSLQALPHPLDPLVWPHYQLWINMQPTQLVLQAEEVLCESNTTDVIACRAWSVEDIWLRNSVFERPYWWCHQGQWKQLGMPALPESIGLSVHWGTVVSVEDEQIWISCMINSLMLSCGEYGTAHSHICSDCHDTPRGHDLSGKIQLGKCRLTSFEAAWPTSAKGLIIRSQPFADGRRLHFSEESRSNAEIVFTLMLGDQAIPGLWLLEFLVSDNEAFVALLPASRPEALGERVVVLELATGCLHSSPHRSIKHLYDFANGVLHAFELYGFCSDGFTPHVMQPANLPPMNDKASAGKDPTYKIRRFQLSASGYGLEPMPDWRLVDRSQIANADGDFILPAPNRHDAAWLQGTETEYLNTWMRIREPRLNGYLLTASGSALYGVTPSFDWSDDSRYLALTHMIPRGDLANNDPQHQHQWQIWLLDTYSQTLRVQPSSIGRMPKFERYHRDGWIIRGYTSAWDNAKDLGRVQYVSLSELLMLPAEQLEQREHFWHRQQELQPISHWQAFDYAVLSQWRKQ